MGSQEVLVSFWPRATPSCQSVHLGPCCVLESGGPNRRTRESPVLGEEEPGRPSWALLSKCEFKQPWLQLLPLGDLPCMLITTSGTISHYRGSPRSCLGGRALKKNRKYLPCLSFLHKSINSSGQMLDD